MGDCCFSAANKTFWLGLLSLTAGLVEKVKSFYVRLTAGLVGKLTSIHRFLISKLQLPLLPVTNNDSTINLIIQTMQKLKLGKFAFKLATNATVGLIFYHALEEDDQASSSHYLIIVGFMVSCMLLYIGLVFGAINPRLGNFLHA